MNMYSRSHGHKGVRIVRMPGAVGDGHNTIGAGAHDDHLAEVYRPRHMSHA